MMKDLVYILSAAYIPLKGAIPLRQVGFEDQWSAEPSLRTEASMALHTIPMSSMEKEGKDSKYCEK